VEVTGALFSEISVAAQNARDAVLFPPLFFASSWYRSRTSFPALSIGEITTRPFLLFRVVGQKKKNPFLLPYPRPRDKQFSSTLHLIDRQRFFFHARKKRAYSSDSVCGGGRNNVSPLFSSLNKTYRVCPECSGAIVGLPFFPFSPPKRDEGCFFPRPPRCRLAWRGVSFFFFLPRKKGGFFSTPGAAKTFFFPFFLLGTIILRRCQVPSLSSLDKGAPPVPFLLFAPQTHRTGAGPPPFPLLPPGRHMVVGKQLSLVSLFSAQIRLEIGAPPLFLLYKQVSNPFPLYLVPFSGGK